MEILNERVNPPILIKCSISKSTSKLSRVSYLDPEDRGKFSEKELTPLELGLVIQWSSSSSGDVALHLPLRVMCKRLASSLRGLKSYETSNPTTLGERAPESLRKRPTICLQDFSLSRLHWEELRRRLERTSWVIEQFSVNTEKMFKSISKGKELVANSLDTIKYIRNICSVSCKESFGKEDFTSVLSKLEEVQKTIEVVKELRCSLLAPADKLHLTSASERVGVLDEIEELDKMIGLLDNLTFERYEREAIHRYKVSSGGKALPTHLRSLEKELGDLKEYFPSLQLLTVDGEDVVLNLAGVKIVLQSDGVLIRGDLSNLARFSESSIAVGKKGGRNRFKAILREE